MPETSARQAILTIIDAANGNMDKARVEVETWFNAAMDRVSAPFTGRGVFAFNTTFEKPLAALCQPLKHIKPEGRALRACKRSDDPADKLQHIRYAADRLP